MSNEGKVDFTSIDEVISIAGKRNVTQDKIDVMLEILKQQSQLQKAQLQLENGNFLAMTA
jgi:hypothetical protein